MVVIGKIEIFNSTFHWKIENFSSIDIPVGDSILSPIFQTTHPGSRKFEWQLQFFPNGFKEDRKEYMGLFLIYLSEPEVYVTYTIAILNSNQNTINKFTPEQDSPYKKNQSWGISKFSLRSSVFGETNKTLVNDTLLLSCTVAAKNPPSNDEHRNEEDNAKAHFEKLLESGDYSDVTFEIGKEKMQLHKGIITSISPVFLAMFQHQMKENEENIVKIKDVKYEIMKELFRYIYVRKVNNIESIAGDLLAAADKYDVQGLKLKCENVLSASLNQDKALEYLELALNYNTAHLKSRAIEFVVNRLTDYVDKPEFQKMNGSHKDELFRAIAQSKVKIVI